MVSYLSYIAKAWIEEYSFGDQVSGTKMSEGGISCIGKSIQNKRNGSRSSRYLDFVMATEDPEIM